MQINFTLQDMQTAAAKFWKYAGQWRVFAFHGPMASGKTTIITALCRALGVQDTIGSPTYSIINEYTYWEDNERRTLFHMDLYRLENEEEVIRAGVEDGLTSGAICLVEWPDRAPALFDESTVHVHISFVSDTERCVDISLHSGVSS